MKIRISKSKKPVNEFLGGLFSRGGTTSKTKGLGTGSTDAPKNLNNLKTALADLEKKVGEQKVKSLGLSLTELLGAIDDATKLFTGGIGAARSLGMNKTNAAINIMKQEYEKVLENAKDKKLTAEQANNIITGIARLANYIHSSMPAFMEENEQKLNEAFGMQRKAVYNFLQSLKGVDDEGNATVKLTDLASPDVAAQAAMREEPPEPPPEAKAVQPPAPTPNTDDEAVQAAMQDVPAKQKQISPEEMADRVNTYSKIAAKAAQQKTGKMITAEDAEKVVQMLMSKNYLKEELSYDSLVDEIVKQSGLDKEVVVAILDSLQNSFTGELEKAQFDKEREQFGGMGVNETLSENLISRKKEALFSEKDAKRYKLLAGLL